MKVLTVLRLSRLAAGLATALLITALAAGCSGSYGGGGGCGIYGGPCPTMPPTSTDCSVLATGPNVMIDLNFGLGACNDKTYASVLGYSTDNAHSQVIKIPVNSMVTFKNTGNLPQSADLLGNSFPPTDTNPGTASAAGADISSANFSTGSLAMGASSAVYKAAVAGVYYFGDHVYYGNGERSVLIVQ